MGIPIVAASKSQKLEVGYTFLLPLLDGTHVLGQIAFAVYVTKTLPSVALAFFAHRSSDTEVLRELASDASNLRLPMMVMKPTGADELRYGAWPMVGHQPVEYSNFDVPRRVTVNSCDEQAATSSLLPIRVEMYWGIWPWEYYGGIDRFLLDGFKVPPYPAHARFKKDFTEEELFRLEERDVARIRANVKRVPSRRGSRKTIHIRYAYEGSGLPGVEQLRRRQALETKLGEKGAGVIEDAGAGGGIMDVYVSTRDVEKSRPIVDSVLAELGVLDASITTE
jgi:hypothetical protein